MSELKNNDAKTKREELKDEYLKKLYHRGASRTQDDWVFNTFEALYAAMDYIEAIEKEENE
jgi:hypothetical protein